MLEIAFALLAISLSLNLALLYWSLKKRVKASPQVRALQRTIAAFEVEGETILHISKIRPENMFLRNPGER